MAIFKRLTKEEIRKNFKYKGLAYGIVPIYLSCLDDPAPNVEVRNWIPDWTFEVVSWLYFFLFDMIDPLGTNDRAFPFKITGKIK